MKTEKKLSKVASAAEFKALVLAGLPEMSARDLDKWFSVLKVRLEELKEAGTGTIPFTGVGTFYLTVNGNISFRASSSIDRDLDADIENVDPSGFPIKELKTSCKVEGLNDFGHTPNQVLREIFEAVWVLEQVVSRRGVGRFSIRPRKVNSKRTIVWTFGFYSFIK